MSEEMNVSYDKYVSPLSERYASREMQAVFSPDRKFRTWRKLWIALAETEKELGLDITDEQIAELKAHAEDINYAEVPESQRNHSPRSHILLRRRQYGHYSYEGCARDHQKKTDQRDL